MADIDEIWVRSVCASICRDHDVHTQLYTYSLDILCLMALTEELGLQYGEFVN